MITHNKRSMNIEIGSIKTATKSVNDITFQKNNTKNVNVCFHLFWMHNYRYKLGVKESNKATKIKVNVHATRFLLSYPYFLGNAFWEADKNWLRYVV